jgi:hypothetical protein
LFHKKGVFVTPICGYALQNDHFYLRICLLRPQGAYMLGKKMAGSVSLEHSTIKMVKMMYSYPIVPEIGWLNLVLFQLVLITVT